jgi:LysR family transcriptional regulator, glycine cleavage system transcriptional activator
MSVPLVKLPSLDLIRGFVAVGRRMSITLAARDLFITQSAVSRQIRTLESQLGIKLLARGHRSVAFTPEGERLFRSANGAVQQLQDAIGVISPDQLRSAVTITCTIGIASLWLLPRLTAFQQEHRDIDLRLAASDRLEDLRGDGIDLAIRYCSQEGTGEGAEWLFGEVVAPVAHPGLQLETLTPRTIEQHCLLEFDHVRFPWLQWQEWLAMQNWANTKPKRRLRFNQYDQVIAAAVAGQGIALGRLGLLGKLLSDGRLKVLSAPKSTPATKYGYWLIKAKPHPREDVQSVAQWIRRQAAATESGDVSINKRAGGSR